MTQIVFFKEILFVRNRCKSVMPLTKSKIRHFRSLAHHLNPIVLVGEKGITDNLLVELDRVLEDHELIKIRITADKAERHKITEELCQASGAELIQIIGRISVLYRKSQKKEVPKKPSKK
jgi:RNA-binding protein